MLNNFLLLMSYCLDIPFFVMLTPQPGDSDLGGPTLVQKMVFEYIIYEKNLRN